MATNKRILFDEKDVGGVAKRVAILVDEADAPRIETMVDRIKRRKELDELNAAVQASIVDTRKGASTGPSYRVPDSEVFCRECYAKLTDATAYRQYPFDADTWCTTLCASCYQLPKYKGQPYRSNDESLHYLIDGPGCKPIARFDFDHVPTCAELHAAVLKRFPLAKSIGLFGAGLIGKNSTAPAPEIDNTGCRGTLFGQYVF